MTLELRKEQIETLGLAMKHKAFMDRSDPGTGKTPPFCVWVWWQWYENKNRTIWIMPKSIMKKNLDELLLWSEFKKEDVVIVDGTPKKCQKLIESDAKVFIMGSARFVSSWRTIRKVHPDAKCIGVDEWHLSFKGPESKRTGELFQAMDKDFEWLYGMTGTLIAGGLDSAYSAVQLMYQGKAYFGLRDFYNQHAIMDPIYEKPMAWRNHEKLTKLIETFSVRRTFEEVYGKENKVIIREKCEMSPKQREAYDRFEREATLELEDQFLDGAVPGVATIRCRQIMAHPERLRLPAEVYEPGQSKPTIILKEYNLTNGEPTGKDEQLTLHLEEHKANGKPLLIFATLVPEQERIRDLCASMGLSVALINGSVSATRRGEIDEGFREGRIQVVVGSPATATVGFNWSHLDHIIFVSMDYQDDNFLQAYRRAMRGVRKTALRITILEYRRSIDQIIFMIVREKSKDANKVDNTVNIIEFEES